MMRHSPKSRSFQFAVATGLLLLGVFGLLKAVSTGPPADVRDDTSQNPSCPSPEGATQPPPDTQTREIVRAGQKGTLLFVLSASGHAISGAEVRQLPSGGPNTDTRCMEARSTTLLGLTDDTGSLLVEPKGQTLCCYKEHYLPVAVTIRPHPQVDLALETIVLRNASRVRVSIRDGSGNPAPGVPITMSRGVLPDRVDEGGLLLVGPQSKNCIYHAVTNSDGVCEVFGNPGEGYVYALDSNDWHVVEAVAHDAEGVMQPPTTATMPGALDLVVAEVAMLAVQSTREKLLGLQWAPTDTETFKPVMLPGDLTSRVERQAARLCPDAVCLVGLREMFADTITVKAILATRGIIEMQVRPLRPSDFKEPYDIALGRDVECDKGRLILHFASPEKRAGALQRIPVAVGSSHKVPLLLETGVEYCLPVGRYVVCPEMTMAADAAKVDIKSGQLSDVFL